MAGKGKKAEHRGKANSSLAVENPGKAPAPGKRPSRDGRGDSGPPPRWSQMVTLASAAGLVLGGLMIALSLISVSISSQVSASQNTADPLDYRSKGSPSAPVVISDWFDFQCPACRVLAVQREPEIEKLYVDTGQVRYVSRNYAFLGPESFLAAEAAECAADQGRYWAYRDLLFRRQRGENLGAFSPGNLKGFAGELGLDQQAFNACFDSGKYKEAVVAETAEGEALGINATPTLIINGKQVRGVPAMDRLKTMIEEELAAKP